MCYGLNKVQTRQLAHKYGVALQFTYTLNCCLNAKSSLLIFKIVTTFFFEF